MDCSDLISIIDVVITAVLTAIIIYQTHKINNKQLEFEKTINEREEDLQKRQIQIDTFPYKREIYANTFAVFECCNLLKNVAQITDLNSKSGKELSTIFSDICEKYIGDSKAVLWSLKEAEYIMPQNISDAILDIRSRFSKICSNFTYLVTIEPMLTTDELKSDFPKIKEKYLKNTLSECDKILSNERYIESIIPKELKIAELNR